MAVQSEEAGEADEVDTQADWKEGFKKKQVGVSDMTLLSTISNDSINDNLKKRCVLPLPVLQILLTRSAQV